MDNLLIEGKIPPVTAVFISNPDGDARARELPAKSSIIQMSWPMSLVPQVNKNYREQ